MRPLSALVAGLSFWMAASAANAQQFCSDIRGIIAAAPTEFGAFAGEPVPDASRPQFLVFQGAQQLTGAGTCALAQQTAQGRRFSTGYTCARAAPDSEAGMESLLGQLRECLDLTTWTLQSNGTRFAQYGLLRISISRNGERGGLALGVEAFRDERDQVMGSPTRGDAIDANGVHRCTSKTPGEIARFLADYGGRPGAERFETEQFVGYTNRVSRPVVAFATRPVHPAHPAIVVRDAYERDGSWYVTTSGDFAGDCEAFHALLREVQEMNQSLGRR